jgi:glycosyltransferase involved in cell wall biosynthesis
MGSNRESATSVFFRTINGVAREIRSALQARHLPEHAVVTLRPEGTPKGSVLFSYIIHGFLLPSEASIPKSHTNIWQSWKMAETFVALGYEVDVIHWTNHKFIPRKSYSIVMDVRRNLERLAPMLDRNCMKIFHIDTAHILFHNAAEAGRLWQLQQRRGVTLSPRRFEMPNLGIEHADYATATGNGFVLDTFAYAKKKIYKVPSPCGVMMDWSERNWAECRRRFLWFSSSGLVHKGLDLALEAFREMPEYELTVCAPLEKDKAFVQAFREELYETPNIRTVGWVNIDSDQFRMITASCGAMLHLSCSEGGAPSVKTCMHAGLIPIVSYESGVDVDDFGYSLRDCSIEAIKKVVREVAGLPPDILRQKAESAWAFARRHYTRENFSKEYAHVIAETLAEASK